MSTTVESVFTNGSTSTSTWTPQDVAGLLAGEDSDVLPAMLPRTDGACLLYPGHRHSLFAPPEAAKTTLAMAACAGVLELHASLVYIDLEDTPRGVVSRAQAVGADPDQMASKFHLIEPHGPLDAAGWIALKQALDSSPDLAVIDTTNAAMALHGLNPDNNSEVARWEAILPNRLKSAGIATLELDHVTKSVEGRGGYAIGAQQKKAGVDVAFSLKVLRPLARGLDGLVEMKVEKDRPGHLRALANSQGVVALAHLTSTPGGAIDVRLEPPEDADGPFRPTCLMERISRAIEDEPGLTTRSIRGLKGKNEGKDIALGCLIEEGYVKQEQDGNARRHFSIRPFREGVSE